jgi:hypothetical protein
MTDVSAGDCPWASVTVRDGLLMTASITGNVTQITCLCRCARRSSRPVLARPSCPHGPGAAGACLAGRCHNDGCRQRPAAHHRCRDCRDTLPNLALFRIKAAPAASLARRQRRRSALGGPRGARRAAAARVTRSTGLIRYTDRPAVQARSRARSNWPWPRTRHADQRHGATGWVNICHQVGEDDDHLAVDDSGGEKNWLGQIRGWPAECTCPPLQPQAGL